MVNQNKCNNKNSNKYILTSVALAAALVLARPLDAAKVYAANQYTWTKHEDLDRMGGYYSSAATSANGNHLILGVYEGGENTDELSPLFVSSNYGTTWDNVADAIDPEIRNYWTSTDVTNSGQIMVASSDYGRVIDDDTGVAGKIVISANGGSSWFDITPYEEEYWQKVVISGSGNKIAAFAYNSGEIQISEDGGTSWTPMIVDEGNEGFGHVKSVSMSDDGNTILVGGENDGYNTELFITTDAGDNWQNITPTPTDEIINIHHDLSADGSKIITATQEWDGEEDQSVFFSDNSGLGWENVNPADNNISWTDVAISDDGSIMSVLDQSNNQMYISSDDGANWTEEEPDQDSPGVNSWQNIDMNLDGSQIIVTSSDNAYTNHPLEEPANSTLNLDDAEGGKTITITTPDGTTITCHSAVKESGLEAKDGAYSYPLGLVDFCFSGAEESNQVSLVFVTDLKPNQVAVRKYNPTSKSYATITNTDVSETTLEGKHALLVTYTIVDNGPLDTDPDTGEVADPVGLATLDVSAPNTGLGKSSSIPFLRSRQ